MTRMLVLGGTGEALELASRLTERGMDVTYSLAGRVGEPAAPPCAVRIGGFGGSRGLERWLREHAVTRVVDATHPFATEISAAAASACRAAGVALTRLARPSWRERAGDDWRRVADLPAAARAIPGLGKRVLLTTGRLGASAFAGNREWFLIRSITPPAPPLPERHELHLARGPFAVDDEVALMERHRIDLVVTKDSGGTATAAKLAAAREGGIPVVMVERPAGPDVPTAHTVPDLLRLLEERP